MPILLIYVKKTKILLVHDLIELELAKISHRYVHNTLPKHVNDLFQANAYNHDYLTRARNNPRIHQHRSNIFNKSFLNRAPSIWSKLDRDIQNKTKISAFCKAFKALKLQAH